MIDKLHNGHVIANEKEITFVFIEEFGTVYINPAKFVTAFGDDFTFADFLHSDFFSTSFWKLRK
ncbi:MAG: hypothetical protein H6Q14_266 [Bacteroidetes bacterium]|nr:hypothetical protein [Bacteroidota bacterium]